MRLSDEVPFNYLGCRAYGMQHNKFNPESFFNFDRLVCGVIDSSIIE
jgi:hypothetical protein